MSKHNRKKTIILSAIIFAIAFIICYTLIGNNKYCQRASPNIPDVSIKGDIGYLPTNSNEVVLQATTGLIFKAHTTKQEVNIENPEQNSYNLVISIYLGDGTLISESDYIKPGNTLSQIELSQSLEAGVYKNSVMVYRFYSSNSSGIVSQCELPIEIKCVN